MQTFTFKKTTFLFIFALFSFFLSAQKSPSNYFSRFEILNTQASIIKNELTNQRSEQMNLTLNGWELTLFDSKILSPGYQLRTPDGIITEKRNLPLTLNGYTRSGGRVSLTINDNFIYGFIKENNVTYNIEPLSYYSSTSQKDQFIVYTNESILDKSEKSCGVTEKQKVHKEIEHHQEESSHRAGDCFEVEYAIASDFLMFQEYGSVAGVENHNIGVTNDVQTNYDDEFADELSFEITEQFVANCSTCDPWTTNTDAGTLLDDFTDWGSSANGFNFAHDIGSLWTGRDFAGSTVGIAWLGAVCTQIRYNCLSDFTSNANFKRVMTSHEIGHNFDAFHDASGSPHIMAPTVQNTNSWSSASINDIENFYNNINCLGSCSSSTAPNAVFDFNIIENCVVGQVNFSDQSTGTIVSRFWEFPGGNPATSTAANPTVFYPDAGIFSAFLTVSNSAGSSTAELINEIEIIAEPIADLDYSIDGSTVSFTNLSVTGGFSSTFWDFGDGTSSTEENPIHTYAEDGEYTVILIIENQCGVNQVQTTVTIATEPIPNFTANNSSGCGPLSVAFINNSTSNVQTFLWSFPGGIPNTSNLPNPVVVYANPGNYDVTLTVTNPQGSNQLQKLNFINVSANANANYAYNTNGMEASFDNASSFASSYFWNFGDGNTSTDLNPNHVYINSGTYNVTLIALSSSCQSDTIEQSVNITAAPVSSFTVNNNVGCEPFGAQFTNLSLNNPVSFNWTFEGGNPSISTEANPSVVFANAGTYDVQLITTNAFGADTLNLNNYITVNTIPNPSFSESHNELTFNFQNTSSGATGFEWNFGDGNMSNLENPTHTYGTEGEYNVSFTAINDCGSVNIPGVYIAAFSPTAAFGSNQNEVCPGGQIQFNDTSTGFGITRQWIFEGGSPATSNEISPLVTYQTSGNYAVTLIVTNVSGADTLSITNAIFIKPLPTSFFTEQVNGLEITAINASSNADNYIWTLPGGATSTEQNVAFTASENGNYPFVLVANNSCGSSTYTVVVNLNALPVAEFTSNATVLGNCSPITVQYNALQNAGTTYLWQFEGGNPSSSTEASPFVVYQDSGVYDVMLIVTNALGSDTSAFDNYINLNDVPQADYSFNANEGIVDFSYTGETAETLLWDFAGQGTSSELNPQFTFAESGIYQVTLISSNICGNDTLVKNVEVIISGINDVLISQIKVYPNPAIDIINLETSNPIDQIYTITLSDVLGRVVGKHVWGNGLKTFSISTDQIPSGSYRLRIVNGTTSRVYTIVKQ